MSVLWALLHTEFVHSVSLGCTDFGGPPPGSAVSLQRLWIRWSDCSGFWVCPLQCTCLLLLTCAQTKLERQEPDHTPVSAVWGRQAARTQDTTPAMLCCSIGWGAAYRKHVIFEPALMNRDLYLYIFIDTVSIKISFATCRKSYSAWWRPGCLPLESVGTRTPTCFSQGTIEISMKP